MLARLGFRPSPLLYVTGHVVGSPRANTLLATFRQDARTSEIAGGNDVSGRERAGGTVPVINGGQALAGKFRVGGGFIPTDAGHRKVVLPIGILPGEPVLGAGTTGGVAEERHCLVGGDDFSIFLEFVLPVLALLISTLIDKIFELAIGDLVPIDPIIGQRQFGHAFEAGDEERLEIFRRLHSQHSLRDFGDLVERDRSFGWFTLGNRIARNNSMGGTDDCLISRLFELPQQNSARLAKIFDRSLADELPGGIIIGVAAPINVGPSRCGL